MARNLLISWDAFEMQDICTVSAAELLRLHAENESLRKDAERYRWLAGADVPSHSSRWPRWKPEFWDGFYGGWTPLTGTELDAVLDTEMEKDRR